MNYQSDTDGSDCYDSDKDQEYVPPQKKTKKYVRLTIRSKSIKIPCPEGDSDTSNSESISSAEKRTYEEVQRSKTRTRKNKKQKGRLSGRPKHQESKQVLKKEAKGLFRRESLQNRKSVKRKILQIETDEPSQSSGKNENQGKHSTEIKEYLEEVERNCSDKENEELVEKGPVEEGQFEEELNKELEDNTAASQGKEPEGEGQLEEELSKELEDNTAASQGKEPEGEGQLEEELNKELEDNTAASQGKEPEGEGQLEEELNKELEDNKAASQGKEPEGEGQLEEELNKELEDNTAASQGKEPVGEGQLEEELNKGLEDDTAASLDQVTQPVEIIENVIEGHEELHLGLEEETEKKLTRKRTRNPEKWAHNIRKNKFDRGLEYISSRKKVRPARKIVTKKDCVDRCLYKCARKISDDERKLIFSNYYKLDANAKRMFILNTTKKCSVERRRKGKNSQNSRKMSSYSYFFILKGVSVQVCKMFYCGTLSISQKPIYSVHTNATTSHTLVPSTQGKHKKKFISEESVNLVKEHIKMFPTIESHYCRAECKRQYLEGDLSIQKMYDLYKEYVTGKGGNPVKLHKYREIFCTQFNYSFNKPAKDMCDLCAEVGLKEKEDTLTDEKKDEYERHINEKNLMRDEKKNDKESGKAILCFDLENVLTCPKGGVKNFFYKSKLNVYNMTAHISIDSKVYCVIWSEALQGRAGNDIASAVYKILSRVTEDYPLLEELILWSDSCVPQNRNSLMSYAIAHLLQVSPSLRKVTMKFSVPGHSCIQEVDSVHSAIERTLRKSEYSSPLSLIRVLLKVNSKKPYTILQMREQDFFDFSHYSVQLNYKAVPFSKVVALEFNKSFYNISYRLSFSEEEYTSVNLRQRTSKRQSHVTAESEDIIPTILKKNDYVVVLGQNKVSAIKSMFKWMPKIDVTFYETIFNKINKNKK